MENAYLFYASVTCLCLGALLGAVAALAHKRKLGLGILTGGAYIALVLLFLLKDRLTGGTTDLYSLMIAGDYALDVFLSGYHFDKLPGFYIQAMDADYRGYALALFIIAPILTVSTAISFFRTTVDKLRYALNPGGRYILSELNAEAVALAESIRKAHPYAQIVFTGVGRPEKKHETGLVERAREIRALCLKKEVTQLRFGLPFGTNWVFLISRHEPTNVAEALALIEKYKNSRQKLDISVYAASAESKLAIDGADKGDRCLHPKFREYMQAQLPGILQEGSGNIWTAFARLLEDAPLEGHFRIRCVDTTEQTIRKVLTDHYKTIHLGAKERGRVVGITILGFGKHGATLLKNAAWIFQFLGYRLEFNIVDLDGKARKYLRQEAPELLSEEGKERPGDANLDICFLGQDQGINCLCSDFDDMFLETFWQRMESTQLVFVSLGDDGRNIAAATHIRELFTRKAIEGALAKLAPDATEQEKEEKARQLRSDYENPDNIASPLIFAVVTDRHRADNLRACAKGKKGDLARCNYHIEPVGALADTYHIQNLLDTRKLEKSALKNHLTWSFKSVMLPKKGEMDQAAFQKLVENAEQYVRYSYYRDSSVATSLHQQLLKGLQEELKDTAVREKISVAEVKKITEKMRWNAYMRAQGFRYSPVRNDRIKQHPLLVPYDQLPPEEKEKDIIEF